MLSCSYPLLNEAITGTLPKPMRRSRFRRSPVLRGVALGSALSILALGAGCTSVQGPGGTADADRVEELLSRGELDRAARVVRNAGPDGFADGESRDRMLRVLEETRRSLEAAEGMGERDARRLLLCTLRYRLGVHETALDPDLELDPNASVDDAVDSDVEAPESIFAPAPRYTSRARRVRYQGEIPVRMIVDAEGCVRTVEPRRREVFGLVQRTVETMSTWVFRPAFRNGEPVAVFYDLTSTFRLQPQPRSS